MIAIFNGKQGTEKAAFYSGWKKKEYDFLFDFELVLRRKQLQEISQFLFDNK